MQVNENGVISFDEPWAFSHPNRFPTTYVHSRLGHALAPFWSDNDIRKEGDVRYVAIEGNSAPDDGGNIFFEASNFVNRRFVAEDEPSFVPTWMLVAQWDHVHPYPHGSDDHEGIDEDYLRRVNKNALHAQLGNHLESNQMEGQAKETVFIPA